MSTFEWVIEQESGDGVTTNIVFDFADDATAGHGNDSLVDLSSSSCHTSQRRDGRGRGITGGASVGGGFMPSKDVTRSEGGSSRRSSKRSNGSRSRPQRQHPLGTTSRGGAFLSSGGGGLGVMAMPSGSAYTSVALRQRYQRMLVGGGRGGTAASVSRTGVSPATVYDAAASTSSPGRASPIRLDPSAAANGNTRSLSVSSLRGVLPARQQPSASFKSTYAAELVDEENSQRNSTCPTRRPRCGRASNSSSSGGGMSNVASDSLVSGVGPATSQRGSDSAFTAAGSARRRGAQAVFSMTAAPVTPSLHHYRLGEAHDDDSDDGDFANNEGFYYALRDVWAMRSTCPRTIRTPEAECHAFPPLHPINVEEEAKPAEIMANCMVPLTGGTVIRGVPSGTADANTTSQAQHGPARDQEGVDEQLQADTAEEYRRYNKMLLKKERQRQRGWEWRRAESGGACTSSSRGASRLHARERCRGPREEAPPSANPHTRRDRTLGVRSGFDGYEPAGCTSSDNSEEDASDESSDISSLECLSNSSREDVHARDLRDDPVFAATVQSLASRAERERKRMETREEQMLWSEAAQNTQQPFAQRSLLKPARTASSLSPSADPAVTTAPVPSPSIAAGVRRGDGFPLKGSVMSGPPSSFFISPIHQSVAAESASWTSGTRFQFLGQGGLGGNNPPTLSSAPSSRAGQSSQLGCTSTPPRSNLSRRRRRSRDGEGSDAEMVKDSGNSAALSSAAPVITADAKTATHRVLKRRKRGDCVQQTVVGECGGSRALRPVAAPSIRPPLELLPCSKKDMCESLLETFLMEAVLDDDDFRLC
ncbi:hypothetical protein JKF63_02299 [Porcisia hertigi]|uniref:Uncharacterized protein n=1 Tax=Porcisia hertigi TaxID=2761500 RepID=A0A836L1Y1_9TRYP|nr:hypothetical protein JKF63_02299 [Porcisia hertigi]